MSDAYTRGLSYRGPKTYSAMLAYSDGHVDRDGIETFRGAIVRWKSQVEGSRSRVRAAIDNKRHLLLSDWPVETLPQALACCDSVIRDALKVYRWSQGNLRAVVGETRPVEEAAA